MANDKKVISSEWETVKTSGNLWSVVRDFMGLTDYKEQWYIDLTDAEKENYAKRLSKCCDNYCDKYVKNENAEFILQRFYAYGRAYYAVIADGEFYCGSPVGEEAFLKNE